MSAQAPQALHHRLYAPFRNTVSTPNGLALVPLRSKRGGSCSIHRVHYSQHIVKAKHAFEDQAVELPNQKAPKPEEPKPASPAPAVAASAFEEQIAAPAVKPEVLSGPDEEPRLPAGVLFTEVSGPNIVRIIQIPDDNTEALSGARIMLLDHTNNIHSIYNPDGQVLFGAYWDALGALPPIVPKGTIGWLGLGAGSAAQVTKKYWPERSMEGWEMDESVIKAARQFMGLSKLESGPSPLVVHISDAFSDDAVVEGGFA
eukprot:CAMPEP_0198202770 /NCGR_PEP_ID=MMETSP1445-20131203/5984_1 /TAXON_ID=36898 /ORGANISM="Pyramimonas sp., Strain CCMP2087" /LENGTH=257 /DNA_ID=CAMNT_0043873851 /DNA_START=142 /DNA_END=912 /DNA_ORIENTATION=-